MNWLVFAIAAWLTLGLEIGLRDGLALGETGVAPSFLLILMVVAALWAPKATAMGAAMILGLLADLTRVAPAPGAGGVVTIVGPMTLGFALGCYTTLTLRVVVMRRNVVAIAGLVLVAGIMAHILAAALLALRSGIDPAVAARPLAELGRGVGVSAYSGAASLLVGPLMLFLTPAFGFPSSRRTRSI